MSEKIIIVEDDGGVRFFLEEALKDEGYNTRAFESYEEASFEIGNDTGLIIMDIKLPGMDGLTAIEDIRKRADVPILIITAHGTKKNAIGIPITNKRGRSCAPTVTLDRIYHVSICVMKVTAP